MTETQTQTIAELEKAVRDASRQERRLALEVDSLPEKIKEAARQDARSKAAAARTGEDIAAVDEASDVNAMRQREAELPYLRWYAAIRTAALEVELNQAQKETQQEKADEARPLLKPAREEMEEASERFNDIRATVLQAEGAASTFSLYASDARKRLRMIENEYPGV
jgi:predicted  nucleic acid-binding Zn-ribbon protein